MDDATMRRRRGMGLGLLAVLLALGVLFWGRKGSDTPAQAPRAEAAKVPAPAAASLVADVPSLQLQPARLGEAPASPTALGAVEGVVVSAAGGAGVAGAELTFAGPPGVSTVRTGPDGRFRYAPEREGTWQLASVAAPGFVPFGPAWGESPVTLQVRPGKDVLGLRFVLRPELRWTVRVEAPPASGGAAAPPGGAAAAPGGAAAAPGSTPTAPGGVPGAPGDASSGTPVAGAEVRLGSERTQTGLFPRPKHFTTGTNGEVEVLAAESTWVSARAPGFTPAQSALDLRLPERRVVLRLGRPGADGGSAEGGEVLAGRVVDEGGGPVGEAEVWASPSDPVVRSQRANAPPSVARVEPDGAFAFDALPAGRYDVRAALFQRTPALAREVPTGRRDVVLTLVRGARLTGRVKGPDGAPVPSFHVELSRHEGPLQREEAASATVVDAEGRFTLEGVGPGRYTVSAVAHGLAPARADVEVRASAPTAGPVELQLQAGARLEGVVVEEGKGTPVPGARVSVEGTSGGGALAALYDAQTDAAGRFVLEALPPGRLGLALDAEGFHSRVVSTVAGPGAPPLPPVTLRRMAPGEQPGIDVVGIGAVLTPSEDALVLGQVVPGGGAEEAGLKPGDALVRLDGQAVVELGFPESIQRIRGQEGTRVVLGIRRGGKGDVVDVTVVRRRIQR